MKLTEGFNLLATAPDGIKRLRELILSLAVQGKLVPQDANDEPASELLKQIRAEKDLLIAEGKLKKDKPLPAISDDEKPFELPEGWEWVRLGQISDFVNGFAFPSNQFIDNGIGVVKIGDIQNGQINTSGMSYVSSEFANGLDSTISVHPNDMLIAMSGATTGKLGFNKTSEVFLLNQRVGKITLLGINQNFAFHYLTTKIAENLQKSVGSAIPNLSTAQIKEIEFPLPPLAEQSRIVAKVEELMALCDALETRGKLESQQHARLTATLFDALAASESAHQLQENWARLASNFDLILDRPAAVDALEQTLLQLAVRGLLVEQDPNDEPASELLKQIRAEKDRLIAEGKIKKDKPLPAITEEEKPFELPEGWVWGRMEEICRPISSGSTPAANEFLDDGGIPYLKVYNIRNQVIDFDYKKQFISEELNRSKLKRSVLYPGDVVMNIVGPPLGKVAIIPDTYPEWNCNQAIAFFGLIPPMNCKYVWTFLCENSFLNNIELIGTAGQDNISVTKSKNILVPVPPLAEQSRIVARVEALRALCAQLRERLTASQKIQTHLAETLVEHV